MEVILAGMNVDVNTLDEFRDLATRAEEFLSLDHPEESQRIGLRQELREFLDRRNITPETLSAAYARISRDPRPVDELRRAARLELDRARKSNEKIIFGLGHASVAEHAVFNLDVLGISRLAAEFVERFRLCSYTEKSQRYITLEGDFVTPVELLGTPLEDEVLAAVEVQTRAYFRFYERLKEYFDRRFPEMAGRADGRRTLDGWAKEDARYGLSLAVQTQLGMTANARNVERILQQAAAHPLAEIREFGGRLFRVVQGVAPSLIKYTDADAYHRLGLPVLRETIRRSAAAASGLEAEGTAGDPICRLADPGSLEEERILAGLAYEVLGQPLSEDRAWADRLDDARIRQLVTTLAGHLEPYHSLPRAFELAGAAFECVVSASCFAQLKRHRMGTLLTQEYDPRLGLTVPPSLQAVGFEAELREVAARSEAVYRRIRESAPEAAAYILTNAHRRRVLLQLNFREMAHFSRLRMDEHAQWDIRDLAGRMAAAVREKMPRLGGLLCGKDAWHGVKKSLVQNP